MDIKKQKGCMAYRIENQVPLRDRYKKVKN